MIYFCNIFTPSANNIFFVAGVAALIGFLIGFLLRSAAVTKSKKRILTLEDDMLVSHSRILEEEIQIASLKAEIARLNGSNKSKAELKVS
ncbi:hypothetical protein BH11BAC6_BH11BAC6_02010 [soil metagenome]